MYHDPHCRSAPAELAPLVVWILERIREPSATWKVASRRARVLPWPVNLPGMDKAAAAVLARYCAMPDDWCADVIQQFMHWLLRPQTPVTLARSALSGIEKGAVRTVEAGIAWRLRMEMLSQANRAYRRWQRERELLECLADLVMASLPGRATADADDDGGCQDGGGGEPPRALELTLVDLKFSADAAGEETECALTG